jgi:hypothetical protein
MSPCTRKEKKMSKVEKLLMQLVGVLVPQAADLADSLVIKDDGDIATVWLDFAMVIIVVKINIGHSDYLDNDWFALSLYAESKSDPGLTFSVRIKSSALSTVLDIKEVDGGNINLMFTDVSDIPWENVGMLIGKALSEM